MSYHSSVSGDAFDAALGGSFCSREGYGSARERDAHAGGSREWRLDLREVSERLNVQVSHLVDGMLATGSLTPTHDASQPPVGNVDGAGLAPLPPGAAGSDCGSAYSVPISISERPDSYHHSILSTPKLSHERTSLLDRTPVSRASPAPQPPSPRGGRSHAISVPSCVPSASSKAASLAYNNAVYGHSPTGRLAALNYDPHTAAISIRTTLSPVDEGCYDSGRADSECALDKCTERGRTTPGLPLSDDEALMSEVQSRASRPLVAEVPVKKRVGFLTFDGKPIESVYVYEATDQCAIVLDVSFKRPRWAWMCLIVVNALLAYAAYDLQKMEKESTLSDNVAPPVLAWWTSIGQAVLLGFLFPCMWNPTPEDKAFLASKKGLGMLALLGLVMALERASGQVALDYTTGNQGGDVPVHIAITQETFMLLVFRLLTRQQLFASEFTSAFAAMVGMGLMVSNALMKGVDNPAHFGAGICIGMTSSVFSAVELMLAHKLRNSISLILLLFMSQLFSSLVHLPLALVWGASVPDIFNELSDYSEWRYFTAVAALTVGNSLLIHVLSFLHPLTVALAISAQLVFVISFVEDNSSLLSPGYAIFLLAFLYLFLNATRAFCGSVVGVCTSRSCTRASSRR